MRKNWHSYVLIALLVLSVSFFAVQPVQAYEVDNDGRVDEGEIINDDLILGSDRVVMEGTVNGLLLAAGQDIVINGTVKGDAFLFGQNITIGEGAIIQGNLFTGAQTVTVAGRIEGSVFSGTMSTVFKKPALVGRNVYFGGYSLEILPGSIINSDVAAGGYQVIVSGNINRDLNVDVGALKIDGRVGRNVSASVAEPSENTSAPYIPQQNMPMTINPGLYISEDAVIGGNLSYTSALPQQSGIQSQPSGTITYMTPVPDDTGKSARDNGQSRTADHILVGIGKIIKNMGKNFVSLSILGALALWLIPGLVNSFLTTLKKKPWQSAGVGVLTYILTWIAVGLAALAVIAFTFLLAFITLGGLSGFFFWTGTSIIVVYLTLFGMMVSLGSKVIVALLAGRWILSQFIKDQPVNQYASLLLGVLIFTLLRAIPFFGGLVAVVVIAFGLGAASLYIVNRLQKKPELIE